MCHVVLFCSSDTTIYHRVTHIFMGYTILPPGYKFQGWQFEKPGYTCRQGPAWSVTWPMKRLKVMNHFLRHNNIKCLDTILLYKNLICSAFWALGDEKPHFKFTKYCLKSCRKTLGSHFNPFSSIKNLLLKKSVFFFLLPIHIRIVNHLKWIFSNKFAFWIDIRLI